MPNRRRHQGVGRVAGSGYAGLRALASPNGDPLVETIGGLIGGDLGSAVPDQLEPARWNHRRACHSWTAGGALLAASAKVEDWAEICRSKAAAHRGLSHDPRLTGAEQLWHSLVALTWNLLAGFLNGLLAGYVSHLVLDGQTTAGIPVV